MDRQLTFYGVCLVCDLEIFVPMKDGVCPTCQKLEDRVQKLKQVKRTQVKRKRGRFA